MANRATLTRVHFPLLNEMCMAAMSPKVDGSRSPGDDAARLEREILDGIPLAAALSLRVDQVGDGQVQLTAPWEPNRNGHGSLFGGSAVALGLVAGWALVREGLRELGIAADVVIQDLNVRFDRPILSEVRVRATLPARQAWERFCRTVERRGKGRISVRIELDTGGVPISATMGAPPPQEPAVPTVLNGRFVALQRS